ncbi:Mini-ribonuclease 3 [Floricoccus penangensis]|uniref:Mini-ribonuclease 3 n=1 Tax=Floricoccus penangensis TaxID=1859475 RepID=UPI00203DCC1B|nr:Mini-ribonuclease 3 [Floricoccus penangensis]URZ87044.1 Mini-ribonuclease 3 [Floricoccus penangensis]
MANVDVKLLNGIALAYAGDSIYEVYVRDHLIFNGLTKPDRLHKSATKFVSAKAQAWLISQMEEASLLTEEEWTYFKRGRNANSKTKAKNADILTYRISTGFEAVMGYLHLTGQTKRLDEVVSWCIAKIEEEQAKLLGERN